MKTKFKAWNKDYKYFTACVTLEDIAAGFDGIVKNDANFQFSGLKDKNDVEIYFDSEIFKFKYKINRPYITKEDLFELLTGVLTWNDEELRAEIDIYPEKCGLVCLSFLGNGQMYDFEVIGTMQENPELLEIKP